MADSGQLHNTDVLSSQMRRMLRDDRVRRLATEFAAQWLHVYEFDQLDEKSERHFPEFAALRGAMYEESMRFFTDLFQHDGSRARRARRRPHVPQRGPGPALRHSRRRGPRLAARRWRAQIRPRRHSDSSRHAGQAVRRLAHQPDLARQLAQRSDARREAAAPAEGRAATGRNAARGSDRAPAHRTTQQRPGVCQVPRAHRSARVSRWKTSTPSAASGSRTPRAWPSTRKTQLQDGTEARRAGGPAGLSARRSPRRFRPPVLPQAARLRPGPRGATVGRATAGRNAGGAGSQRLSRVGRARSDRAQPPVPRDSRARWPTQE